MCRLHVQALPAEVHRRQKTEARLLAGSVVENFSRGNKAGQAGVNLKARLLRFNCTRIDDESIFDQRAA